MNPSIEAVSRLLPRAPRPPGSLIPGPASAHELAAFQALLGFEIPRDLRQWLATTNGPPVGPGGLYGVGDVPAGSTIAAVLARHPEWLRRRWIPVAGDGCGNHYVLVASGEFGPGHPIVFVDAFHDPLRPHDIGADYVVASNLWIFLESLLRRDMGEDHGSWFDEAATVARDPAILHVTGAPLPWNAD